MFYSMLRWYLPGPLLTLSRSTARGVRSSPTVSPTCDIAPGHMWAGYTAACCARVYVGAAGLGLHPVVCSQLSQPVVQICSSSTTPRQ